MADVGNLLERIVALETEQKIRMNRVEIDISEINKSLTEIKALANQGKGSLRTFLWIGGLVAGLVGLIGTIAGFYTGLTKIN